jgi:hypothetical protein
LQTALDGKQATITNSDNIAQGSANLFLTTAERTKLTNTSGVNTGDQDLSGFATTSALTTGLAGKENTITAGTTSQYWRGDKTFQTLNKTAVGLANVDNTSDLSKPISTATQTALNTKQDTLVSGTNIKTINSESLLGSGNIVISGGGGGVSDGDKGDITVSSSGNVWTIDDNTVSESKLTTTLANLTLSCAGTC